MVNLSALTFPVHDLPVAWRIGEVAGIPVVAAPSFPSGWSLEAKPSNRFVLLNSTPGVRRG